MRCKKPYIFVNLWGTLAYLAPGPDFGAKIAQLLNITKEAYVRTVKEVWFRRAITASEFCDYLVKSNCQDSGIVKEITRWIKSPLERAMLYDDVIPAFQAWRMRATVCIVSDTSIIGETALRHIGLHLFCDAIYLSHRVGFT